MPSFVELESMQERAEEAARLLKALANAQRIRVLCLLADGEMPVSRLNEQLPELSPSALSQHLARLREEGLVRTRRQSQAVWYGLVDGPARDVIGVLYDAYCAPDTALLGGHAHKRDTPGDPMR